MSRSIQSVERAAAILRLLAGGERQLALADLSVTLGLAKGTVHGILRTLQQEGFVEQDSETGRYQLGAELLRLGNSYLDVHELRARSLMWADDLARVTGESVRIGVLHHGGVLVVHHVFRPDESRQVLEVGSMLPLHATAWGKVLLAFDPVAAGALEDEPKTYTRHTLVDLADVRRRRGDGRGLRRRSGSRPARRGARVMDATDPGAVRRRVTVGAWRGSFRPAAPGR